MGQIHYNIHLAISHYNLMTVKDWKQHQSRLNIFLKRTISKSANENTTIGTRTYYAKNPILCSQFIRCYTYACRTKVSMLAKQEGRSPLAGMVERLVHPATKLKMVTEWGTHWWKEFKLSNDKYIRAEV